MKNELKIRSFIVDFQELLATGLILFALTAQAQLPAFPGAEGFGQYAIGGRGGTVYHVTNLNDSGPGSFRDAVSVAGRTVVFDVGGVIDYQAPRYAPKSNITIAGQTAPGGGITIYGNGLSFSGSHNNICRFIRVREGVNGNSGTDALGIANGHDMIFDHISVSWGLDETFSVSGDDPSNITIQSTIISQGLQTHSAGGLIQTPGGVSILRSLYIDNDTRNPKVKFVNEFVNNVVCNWENIGYNMGGDSAGDSYVNMFNNYFIRGPQSSSTAIGGGNANFHIYATNNWYDSNRDGVLNGSEMSFASYGPMDLQFTPYPYPITTAVPPLTALKVVISEVGASLPRDQVDDLLMTQLTSWGTSGGTISSELSLPTGGPGIVANGIPYTDTDQDGMPDYWEVGNGSNPLVPDNNAPSPSGSGYTRLEDYLNWLAEPHGVALTNAVVGVDLRQLALGFEIVNHSPVYSVHSASNGTVSLDAGIIARFVPAFGLSAPASFRFTVNDSDGSSMTRTVNLIFTPSVHPYNPIWHGDDAANNWEVGGDVNWFDGISLVHPFQSGESATFDDTGSTNPAVSLLGSIQPASVTVTASNSYSFSGSGSLDGSMALGKSGSGTLRLNTSNNYTGVTTVNDGTLLVNGALTASPLTVLNGGAAGGAGFLGSGVDAQSGSVVIPGDGLGVPGTLTITNGLTENGSVTNRFDLSDDPSGQTKTNDRIHIEGDLNLGGVNSIKISLLDGLAGDGVYTLITYTGNLNGSLANLNLSGVNGVLTNPPNAIAIIVSSVRPPANLAWRGSGNVWDTGVSVNWMNDGVPDRFYFLDSARFDDTGSASPSVVISGNETPSLVIVDALADYSFGGGGKITGTSGLVKTNSGTLTVSTLNDYTGPTIIGGGTLQVSSLANGGAASGIGASGSSAANLMFYGGSLRYTGGSVGINRDATLAGDGAFDIVNSGTTYTENGSFSGPGAFIKEGSGTFVIPGANTHSGGNRVGNGTVNLTSTTARDSGLGAGLTSFEGGTLQLYGYAGSTGNDYGTFNKPLHVATGQTGTLLTPPRYDMASTLTGGGALNMQVDYVRGRLSGNWSAFTGVVNATARSNPSEFRIANGNMFQNATVILNNNVLMVRNGGSSTINIGALGGTAGATVGKGNSTSSGTTYRVGWNNGDTTWSGSFENDGTTTVTKEGSGIWTITSPNSWSGGLTINGGTVLANNASGSAFGSGAILVSIGGSVGGTGYIGAPVTISSGGAIAPGAGVGTLTINNNLVFNTGSVMNFELGTVGASDKVVVNGNLTLNGTINVANVAGFAPGTYTLFTYTGSRVGLLPGIGLMPAGYAGALSTSISGQVRMVVTQDAEPVINNVSISGDQLEFGGSGGTANGEYYLITSTNVTLPFGEWTKASTNQFDSAGNFSVTNLIDFSAPQVFYGIQLP